MTRGLTPLAVLLLLNACSLVHNDLPNESPSLQVSRVICQAPDSVVPDTLINGSGEICQVRRGAEIRFEVRGADEDDDPLVYRWEAFGAGSFRDSIAIGENSWFAPMATTGTNEQFIIQVTITDRNCSLVIDEADRQRCLENSEEIVENFIVEVVQRRPTLSAIADTTVPFSQRQFQVESFGNDPDGDPLEYRWAQSAGPEGGLSIGQEPIRDEETAQQIGSRASILALLPGDYLLRASTSDGEFDAEREISLQIPVEPPLPEDGMVRLTLPTTGREYEIDVYEYPNIKGEMPQQTTFFEAVSLCGQQGKRLCSPTEWQVACQGEEGLSFSSTDDPTAYAGLDHYGVRFCNTTDALSSSYRSIFVTLASDPLDQIAPAGSFPNCGGTTGVYDLTGNLGEWTATLDPSNDLDVSVMRSNMLFNGTCDFAREAGTLQIAGENIYDPAILQQQIATYEALDEVDRQQFDFEQEFVGFRCCR